MSGEATIPVAGPFTIDQVRVLRDRCNGAIIEASAGDRRATPARPVGTIPATIEGVLDALPHWCRRSMALPHVMKLMGEAKERGLCAMWAGVELHPLPAGGRALLVSVCGRDADGVVRGQVIDLSTCRGVDPDAGEPVVVHSRDGVVRVGDEARLPDGSRGRVVAAAGEMANRTLQMANQDGGQG